MVTLSLICLFRPFHQHLACMLWSHIFILSNKHSSHLLCFLCLYHLCSVSVPQRSDEGGGRQRIGSLNETESCRSYRRVERLCNAGHTDDVTHHAFKNQIHVLLQFPLFVFVLGKLGACRRQKNASC